MDVISTTQNKNLRLDHCLIINRKSRSLVSALKNMIDPIPGGNDLLTYFSDSKVDFISLNSFLRNRFKTYKVYGIGATAVVLYLNDKQVLRLAPTHMEDRRLALPEILQAQEIYIFGKLKAEILPRVVDFKEYHFHNPETAEKYFKLERVKLLIRLYQKGYVVNFKNEDHNLGNFGIDQNNKFVVIDADCI